MFFAGTPHERTVQLDIQMIPYNPQCKQIYGTPAITSSPHLSMLIDMTNKVIMVRPDHAFVDIIDNAFPLTSPL